jgi:hypothetical protein
LTINGVVLWTPFKIGLKATMAFNRYDRPSIEFTRFELLTTTTVCSMSSYRMKGKIAS